MTLAATIRHAAPALLLAAGCAHLPRPALVAQAGVLDCEAAEATLAARPPHPARDLARRAVTAPASWLLTGTAYATDLTLTTVGGVCAGALVCMPILLLEGSLGGSGEGTGQCIGAVAGEFVKTGGLLDLGDRTAGATRSWRCLDPTGEAREVLATAGCYRARGAPGDRDAARALLRWYWNDQRRLACTPLQERRAIETALWDLAEPPAGGARRPAS